MSTLTLFEHETVPLELSARQLTLLDQLQQRLSEKVLQPIYRTGAWHLRAGQYVGVVRLGAQTIQILPKTYRSSDATDRTARAREATANLLHMLAYAGMVQVAESEVADLLSRDSDWFEILTYLFARHLLAEWQRGPVRSYQTVEDELPLLKGKWRLQAQFRRPDRAHRFAVAYDEFTVDILLNRIFRFVIERLSRLSRSALSLRLLGDLRGLLDEVALLPALSVADAERVNLDRLSARYGPLLNLARLFLDGAALQTAAGETSLFAFVFDMNVIFEGFVTGFLRRHRSEAIPPELLAAILTAQSGGAPRYLAHSEGHRLFWLKPYLLFQQGGTILLIADTKYKPLNPAEPRLGISEADFYQMLAYIRGYACPRVLLIYPQHADLTSPIRRRFQLEHGDDECIVAATIDLRRDLGLRSERLALAAELHTILSQG